MAQPAIHARRAVGDTHVFDYGAATLDGKTGDGKTGRGADAIAALEESIVSSKCCGDKDATCK